MTRLRARTLLILLTVAFVTILIGVGRWHRTSLTPTAANNIFTDALPASMKHFVSGSLPESAFEWNTTKAPEWLAHPINSGRPLRLRVAIITHPSEFERRHAVRELVLKGVPREEVLVEHLFFLGHVSDLSMNDQVVREAAVHGDIELLDMSDSKTTLGTKRWEALRWCAEADPSSYEWYFSMDTDAFVRFAALARRAASWNPILLHPHNESVVWGNMLTMNRHWRDSHHIPPEDRFEDPNDHDRWSSGDESWRGEWYDYPAGFGYLMSAHLVARLTAPGVKLAHNVSYPFDDMAIGSYIQENAPSTVLVHDWDGFHDPPAHGWKTGPIGWETVVVHHLNVREMRGLRYLDRFKNEWEN